MNTTARRAAVLILAALAMPPGVAAQEPAARKLIVATKDSPPFAMRAEDGSWSGITIDLWRFIAGELGLEYELREAAVPEMIEGLRTKSLDVAAAALTVTHEREEAIDFSHSFYSSGLAIGIPFKERGVWSLVFSRELILDFLKVIAVLVLVLLSAGFLVWIFERRRNPEQFGGGLAEGLGSGFWWSAVTMTTVGYGDKAPRTFWGRAVGLIWMFTSIIIISSFTAAIASVLTVGRLESGIRGPADLERVRVGTATGTTSADYLRQERISFRAFASPREAAEAAASGAIDAVVYDAPLLLYLASTSLQGRLQVLPVTFEPQDYALALQPGSPLREPINRLLLLKISEPEWRQVLYGYLGE